MTEQRPSKEMIQPCPHGHTPGTCRTCMRAEIERLQRENEALKTAAAVDERLDRVERELAKEPSRELIDYGYAPGQYAGKCLDCRQWMDFVDKRCRVCKSCAEKRRDRAAQPPPAEHGCVMQWSTESCPGCGAMTDETGIRFHASGCTWFYGASSETALR